MTDSLTLDEFCAAIGAEVQRCLRDEAERRTELYPLRDLRALAVSYLIGIEGAAAAHRHCQAIPSDHHLLDQHLRLLLVGKTVWECSDEEERALIEDYPLLVRMVLRSLDAIQRAEHLTLPRAHRYPAPDLYDGILLSKIEAQHGPGFRDEFLGLTTGEVVDRLHAFVTDRFGPLDGIGLPPAPTS